MSHYYSKKLRRIKEEYSFTKIDKPINLVYLLLIKL